MPMTNKKPVSHGTSNEKNSNRNPGTVADLESNPRYGAAGTHEVQTFSSPVNVHVHSKRRRECDPDGISVKWALDAVVEAGILVDDSPKHIKHVTFSQEKIPVSEREETVITIIEATP